VEFTGRYGTVSVVHLEWCTCGGSKLPRIENFGKDCRWYGILPVMDIDYGFAG
jgi:hypothetical protein